MTVGRKLQFPKRTSSSWGVPYGLSTSMFGNPSYLCIFGNSRVLSNWPGNAVFLCQWLRRTIILMWKKRTKKRSCLRHHLDCMWRSCWLASVACVGLFSSAYPIVIILWLFFCNHLLVECLHRRLAACIFDLSLRIPHCSSLLALLYSPMSLDSGKRKSETVRHTTWIKCIESETRHTYTWSLWCWQNKGCRYGFSWCNPKLWWPLGFPDRFVMAFGYRLVLVGVSVGDTANMSKIVMSRSTEDTPIGCRIANSQF